MAETDLPYTEATVAKGVVLWVAALCPREGYDWTYAAPTRWGFTRAHALRRIRRAGRIVAARKGLAEKVSL